MNKNISELDSEPLPLKLSQAEKAEIFLSMHHEAKAFIIPNPWDIGTARLLAQLGYRALATTSAGYAFSIGQRDNTIDRETMMSHVKDIVEATNLPVSADLENGFGDSPETVAETIQFSSKVGLVGASIEDATNQQDNPIYEFELAVDRIRAAAEAKRSFAHPFVLTGRTENYLVGRPDLKDTIKRLQAYQEAGADVLYAPGVTSKDDIAAIVHSVDRPVNVVMGLQGVKLSVDELTEIGVKRISVGSSLSRAALGAFLRAANEMLEKGTFNFSDDAVSYAEISAMFVEDDEK